VPNPSVEVLFGTVRGEDVRVLTSSLLHVLSPIHDPGVVDVTVRNVDQDGNLIGAETVTQAAAFTFGRPQLVTTPQGGGGTLQETDLTRCVRTVIEELSRQIIDNVRVTTNVDFGDGVVDGAVLAALPGIVLIGPVLRENRFFSTNKRRSVPTGTPGSYNELRPPYTVDLVFTIVGVDDTTMTELNLQHEVTSFFQRNKTLRMLRDAAVAGDYVELEMEIEPDGDLAFQPGQGNANLRSFVGKFVVRGLDLDDRDMARVQTTEVGDQGVTVQKEAI
jgi:hypothetical protein